MSVFLQVLLHWEEGGCTKILFAYKFCAGTVAPPPFKSLVAPAPPAGGPRKNLLPTLRTAVGFVKNYSLTALFGNSNNYMQPKRHYKKRFVGQNEELGQQ